MEIKEKWAILLENEESQTKNVFSGDTVTQWAAMVTTIRRKSLNSFTSWWAWTQDDWQKTAQSYTNGQPSTVFRAQQCDNFTRSYRRWLLSFCDCFAELIALKFQTDRCWCLPIRIPSVNYNSRLGQRIDSLSLLCEYCWSSSSIQVNQQLFFGVFMKVFEMKQKRGCKGAPIEGGSYREQPRIRALVEKEPLRVKEQLRSFLSAPAALIQSCSLYEPPAVGALLQPWTKGKKKNTPGKPYFSLKTDNHFPIKCWLIYWLWKNASVMQRRLKRIFDRIF